MRIVNLFLIVTVFFAVEGFCIDESEVNYFALLMDGKKVGHVVESRRVTGDKVITTEETNMTIGRGGVGVVVKAIEKSIETVDGKPLGFKSIQNVSGMAMMSSGKVVGDKMKITISAAGSSQKKTIDFPEGALMMEGLRLLSIKKGLKEGTTYTAKAFVPSMYSAVDAQIAVGPVKSVDLFGRVVSLTEVKVKMFTPGGAVESTGYVDSEHNSLKTVTPAMGMELVMIACDREFALSSDDVVDFLDKTIVKSPAALVTDGGRVKGEIVYTLLPTDGKELSILSGDNQKVKRTKDGKVVVTVDPVEMPKGVKFPYGGGDGEILKMVEPATYLQSDDKVIAGLAKKAVKGAKDAGAAARKIEAFVGDYISEKNFSVGYATALEVAGSRQGDCSEHAVLTAAMCRAVGIPARVVSGIVYAEEFAGRKNIFGGHAWTEVYVGGKWVGLDATRAYGAGHIAFAAGSGDPADFFAMMSTVGYFTIEKVENRH